MAAVNLPSAIGGRRGLPDRRAGTYPCINLVRSDMKTLLLTATALAVVCTVSLSPAMANRFGPFDPRLTDDSDALGQNGLSAATTTPDGRHYEWQYHYGHEWEGHWVPVK